MGGFGQVSVLRRPTAPQWGPLGLVASTAPEIKARTDQSNDTSRPCFGSCFWSGHHDSHHRAPATTPTGKLDQSG